MESKYGNAFCKGMNSMEVMTIFGVGDALQICKTDRDKFLL